MSGGVYLLVNTSQATETAPGVAHTNLSMCNRTQHNEFIVGSYRCQTIVWYEVGNEMYHLDVTRTHSEVPPQIVSQPVYYSPDDPSHGLLERPAPIRIDYLIPGVLLCFVACCLMLMIAGLVWTGLMARAGSKLIGDVKLPF